MDAGHVLTASAPAWSLRVAADESVGRDLLFEVTGESAAIESASLVERGTPVDCDACPTGARGGDVGGLGVSSRAHDGIVLTVCRPRFRL